MEYRHIGVLKEPRTPFNMRCNDCGHVWHKRAKWSTDIDRISVCPKCMSTNIEEINNV